MMRAPQGRIGPSDEAVVQQVEAGSKIRERYAEALDRESAYEMLAARQRAAEEAAAQEEVDAPTGSGGSGRSRRAAEEDKGMIGQVVESTAFRSMLRSAGTVIGREVTRSIFGTSRKRR